MQTSRTQLNSGDQSVVAADGSFQVDGLRPGRISVSVYTLGTSSIRPSIVRIEHGGIGLPQGFEIQPGQSVSGLRVVISYGTGTIRGTVRFEGGSLPVDSRTYISCKREGANEGSGAQLDSRGHFVINNLAPGTYEVNLQISVSRNSTLSSRATPETNRERKQRRRSRGYLQCRFETERRRPVMLRTGLEIRRTVVGVTGVALCFLLASTSWAQQPPSGDAKLPERPNGTMAGRVMNSAGEPLVGAVAYVAPVGGNGSSQSAAVDSTVISKSTD